MTPRNSSSLEVAVASDGLSPDAVAVFVLDGQTDLGSAAGVAKLDQAVGGALSATVQRPEFKADAGQLSAAYPSDGPTRAWVVGLGKPARFEANALRAAAAKLYREARSAKVQRLLVHPGPGVLDRVSDVAFAAAVADGFALASFEFKAFRGAAQKSDKPAEEPAPLQLILPDRTMAEPATVQLAIGPAVSTARRLAATPPNVANPRYITDACRELAEAHGLNLRVIDAEEAASLSMGGLTAVGRAGSTPPALIVLEWPGRDAKAQPVMLVGKAITFDTGGYSLKPTGGKNMKYDKCGGMAVIGAMEAIARLDLPTRVVGLIPCAENMVDEQAYRPDDILTMANGVTVEVTNTDAEGRLVLADAMAWGTKQYQPKAVIDLATLTGGVIVALGDHCAGYFCNDDELTRRLESAADYSGEKLWRLPLWPEHRELMRSHHADLVNSSERKAHPIQGAAFLSFFVGEDAPQQLPTLPWAHLDIAGVASTESETPLHGKGPTAYGVRLLTQLLRNWAD